MRSATKLSAILSLLVLASPLSAQRAAARPLTGQYVLQRMHDAYAGKWYKTLTFTQKTVVNRQNSPVEQTWYESMRSTPAKGTQLRIDMGDLKIGRGVLYTADSSWRVTAGVAAAPRPDGNPFIPLIQSVYVQPVAQTAAELTRLGFDIAKAYESIHEGQSVWVVGAASDAEVNVSRFMIDTTRKVVVHAVLAAKGQTPMDIRIGGYVRAGNGWLGTKIEMSQGMSMVQTEEYFDWKTDVALPEELFDLKQWSTAPHWARKP